MKKNLRFVYMCVVTMNECASICLVIFPLDFVLHQIENTQSMSADIFSHKNDIYVAMAVPNSDSCIIMEWDHIETKFRPFDNITGLTT